jgi:ABC-type antimicrobial peptide transport system permease subunit
MMIRESAVLVVIGVAVGGVLAWLTTGYAAALLFGLEPKDPVLFATAALALAALALAASFIPALRAARVDPTTALRSE